MKISLNWMKWYGGQGLDVSIDELVARIGSQLGEVESFENLSEKYQGVLVARVVSCAAHPDSDHMHVCMIDDGGKAEDVERDKNGLVQVVCGAPNVREGLLVAWLPPGSTVPESVGKEPFILGKRELRGVLSNGMLASPRELALGESHDGIMELDGDAKPGDNFAAVYGLDDYIIDIENKMFTHRPDCFGQLGVAREISGISGLPFTSPEWYSQSQLTIGDANGNLSLTATNEVPELVPRIMLLAMSDVKIGPSPVWLQTYLQRVGVRPISNVVDVSNYIMLLTGQPTHAYDYDKVKALDGGEAANIIVRYPKPGEKIKLLNGKEIEPRDEAIMIATETKLIGVGGVMGGFDTEVDDDTKNIILEVASFDMYSIRRTSMAHGLFTDAVTRFNKGQSPLQNDRVAAKAAEMLHEFTGANLEGVIDESSVAGREWVHPPVPVSAEFINIRLGLNLTADDMAILLRNVEFIVGVEDDILAITAPLWRTDVETREDVVEEIGRLYGFDKLPLELPQRTITPANKDAMLELKGLVRVALATAGANEVLTYSFVHGDLFAKVGQSTEHAFELSNALSPDLQYYRTALMPSLLDKIHMNSKAGYDRYALFELGKVHYLGEMDAVEPDIPNEDDHVALVLAYGDKQQPAGAPYYYARQYLEQLVDISAVELKPLADFDLAADEWGRQLTAPYDPGRSAVVVRDGQIWGVVGEFKAGVRKALKLPKFSAGFELHLDAVAMARTTYTPIPRFPSVTQDITLKVAATLPYQELLDYVDTELRQTQPAETVLAVKPLDIYQRENELDYKQITFRIEIASYEKTLTDKEVSKLLDTVAAAMTDKFGAEQI